MVTTRSKGRKLDNDCSVSWPSLGHDVLVLIMLRVGLFDFIALSGVCKSWRSATVSNWYRVMASKKPMYISLSDRMNEKECYLDVGYSRRKMNTMIPHSRGRVCVGLTCGYLIFFGSETRDFWLVNPITRKELHFRRFPYSASIIPTYIKGILVFSPSMSGWVFVVLNSFSGGLSFSLAGNRAKWTYIYSNSVILDLQFFKGKIYTINNEKLLHELRLNPLPTFILQKMKNSPWSDFRYIKLVSSGEKLYLTTTFFRTFEVNFEESKWMSKDMTGKCVVFTSGLKSDAAIEPHTWARPLCTRLDYTHDGDQSKKKGKGKTAYMWYFPHDCLNDKENCALLNVLEEESTKVGGSSSCGSSKRIEKLVVRKKIKANQPN